jgi:hypothetical protein
MSETRARTPSPGRFQSPTPYDERELKSLKKAQLIDLCKKDGIDLTGTTTIATIIDRMQGRTSPSGEASARPASPGRTSVSFTQTSTAKLSPPKGRSASASAARGGDDPVDQLNDERERRVAEWKRMVGVNHPWKDLTTLKHIFDTRMCPASFDVVAKLLRTLVILVGPAASGKSSALERARLGLTDRNTVRVDPDKIYEWLAHKYGYFPPEIKELVDLEQKTGESVEKYKDRCAKNRAKLTKQNADRLAWWLANKDTFDERYGNTVQDDVAREFEAAKYCTPKTAGVLGQYRVVLPSMENMIFEGATRHGLNVLLDTTGGMKEPFLEKMAERFKRAGYKVVVVLVVSAKEDCIARVSGPDGRNAQQHRKLEEDNIGQIWRGFVEEGTSCRWERFSREQGSEFVVVQNTWTPTREQGGARVVYKRNPDGGTESIKPSIEPAELSHILRTYNVETDPATGGFLCRGGSAASKGGPGHGGSSRKRRISRRRIHGSRARKTIKKYSRPVTRRRRRI